MLIHKDALAVSDVVADMDNSKYFLAGALFDAEGRAVVTNGHILLRFTSEGLMPEDFPKMPGLDVSAAADVIVARDTLKSVRVSMATRSHLRPLNYFALVPNGDHVTAAATDLDRDVRITARKIVGTFPNYEKVLTVSAPVLGEVSLGPELLELLARVARKVNAQSIRFTLHGQPGQKITDQLMFRAQGEHGVLDGAIMPRND